jgi:UDP-4-amino-4-deoxy-L-arabinose formyltransferase/UDP-glucuronic acid dehydrogenase (UDP-4-keto-hexauronic acid decarboxylating)
MTKKADAGDIISQEKNAIADDDTAKTLFDKATAAAKVMLARELPKIAAGTASRTPPGRVEGDQVRRPQARRRRNRLDEEREGGPQPDPRGDQAVSGGISFLGDRKCFFWSADAVKAERGAVPGTVLSSASVHRRLRRGRAPHPHRPGRGRRLHDRRPLASDARIVANMVFGPNPKKLRELGRKKSVLILGVNGFIGSHLSERLLDSGKYEVYGLDLRSNYIDHLIGREEFHYREGDISIHREWIEYHIRKCDINLPLVAIATPIEYTRNPLRVFELDFEENLRIVRYCVKYNKRIVFPSTSEVYGMCQDPQFDEDNSKLITGPIRMQRWIYSTSKQLLDRVIWAYGAKGQLQFTLFRPFNGSDPGWTA